MRIEGRDLLLAFGDKYFRHGMVDSIGWVIQCSCRAVVVADAASVGSHTGNQKLATQILATRMLAASATVYENKS
jgi:UDP-3-O-acyl-N-acetylglucosamine deacetylase